jgi:peptidoglycan-associated lipoprotein
MACEVRKVARGDIAQIFRFSKASDAQRTPIEKRAERLHRHVHCLVHAAILEGDETMRNHFFMSLLLLAGCAHKQNKTATAAPPSPPAIARSEPQPASSRARPMSETPRLASCSADLDCQSTQLCIDGRCADAASLSECSMIRVHFDFDKSDLRTGDEALLARFARCLKAEPATHFVVAGNCDERGTEEYNLALGDRRASSVVRYLVSIGASKDQLRAVSYGKERPLCTGHEESCWWQNRRASLRKEAPQASR